MERFLEHLDDGYPLSWTYLEDELFLLTHKELFSHLGECVSAAFSQGRGRRQPGLGPTCEEIVSFQNFLTFHCKMKQFSKFWQKEAQVEIIFFVTAEYTCSVFFKKI